MDEDKNLKTKDWNVPNWRNANEYEYVEKLNHSQKRWEFLRRMPEYRSEYYNQNEFSFPIQFGLKVFIDPKIEGRDPNIDFDNIFFEYIAGKTFHPDDLSDEADGNSPIRAFFLALRPDDVNSFNDLDFAKRVGEAVIELSNLGYHFFIFDPKTSKSEQVAALKKNIDETLAEEGGHAYISRARKGFNAIEKLRVLDAHNEQLQFKKEDRRTISELGEIIFSKNSGESKHKLFSSSLKEAMNFSVRQEPIEE